MIICKSCNQENEEEAAFCGNCGAYLEWEGEKIEAAAPPPPVEEPEPVEERSGLIDRLKEKVGIADDDEARDLEPPAAADTPAPVVDAGPDAPGPGSDPVVEPAARASAPTAAIAAPERPAAVDTAPVIAPPPDASSLRESEAPAAKTDPPPPSAPPKETVAPPPSAPDAPSRTAPDATSEPKNEAPAKPDLAGPERPASAAAVARAEPLVAPAPPQPAAEPPKKEPPKKEPPPISALVAKPPTPAAEPPLAPKKPSASAAAPPKKKSGPAAQRPVVSEPEVDTATPDGDGVLGPKKPQQPPIGAKKPGAEKKEAARKKRRPMQVAAKPGDLICGQCGEPNDPSRKFCRRCANPLAGAEVARKPPWYRRLFTRKPKAVPAGGRGGAAEAGKGRKAKAGRRSVASYARQLLALAIIVLVLSAFVVPSFRSTVRERAQGVFDFFRCLVQSCEVGVPLATATASSSLPGHGALNAIDVGTNTFWSAANESAGGKGEWLCVGFDKRNDLTNVGFFLGARDKSAGLTRGSPRPSRVTLVYRKQACREGLSSTPQLGAQTQTLELRDAEEEVIQKIDGQGVRSVQIIVVSTFPGQKNGNVSIAGVRFLTRP